VDNEGVNFEVDVPNCDLGIRARELTKAGVYDGCSFEFWPDKYDVEEREGKVPLVRHTHFRAITALTLGMDPAYLQTSLHARELYDETPAGKKAKADAEAQRQREEQEKQEAIKKEMHRRVEHLQRLADFDERLESTTY
jgi:phage head maturation protease